VPLPVDGQTERHDPVGAKNLIRNILSRGCSKPYSSLSYK
jgi:hypothetical protein